MINFRVIVFFISLLFHFQSHSQDYNYNPFSENKYATFTSCIDTSSNLKESCFRTNLLDKLSNSLHYSIEKTRDNKDGRDVYFSFQVDSISQISKVFFFKPEDPQLQSDLKTIIFNLPKMVAPIEDGIAGSTEIFLKLHLIPENKGVFSIIDLKTRFEKPKDEKDETNKDIEKPTLNTIEEVPVFPGCSGDNQQDYRLCFQKGVMTHINKNFRFPEYALKNGIKGKVYISFIIDKAGDITKIRTRGPHPFLELEARRIFTTFPKVKPGMIDGAAVQVPFSVPITFAFQ